MKKQAKAPINKQLQKFEDIEKIVDEINQIRYCFYTYGTEREKEYIKALDKQYGALQKQWEVLKSKKGQ